MIMRTSMSRFWLIVVLLATLGGCSDRTSVVPEDFTQLATEGFSLSHPQDWEVLENTPLDAQVAGPPRTSNIRPQAAVTVDQRFAGDFDNAVDGIDELGGLLYQDGRQTISDEKLEVTGARRARLLEATWTMTTRDGSTVQMRQYDLFALTRDNLLIYLAVNSAASDFDESRFRAIIGSFAVA